MMQNNGHPPHSGVPHHVAAGPPQHAAPPPPPPPPHLDPRYMDYATAAAAANMAAPHHHHLAQDPHALHYASLTPAASIPVQHAAAAAAAAAAHAGAAVTATKRGSDGLDGGGYPGGSSDEDGSMDVKPPVSDRGGGAGRGKGQGGPAADPATGKKTKGRVKIKMEFIDNKLRRYTTFSKRKTGIMKKVSEFYNQLQCHADIYGSVS